MAGQQRRQPPLQDQEPGLALENGPDGLEHPLLSPLEDSCDAAPSCPSQPPLLYHSPGEGARYHQQYMHMAAWLGVLFAGYLTQRMACQFGLPYDGLRQIDYLEFFSDTTSVLLYGTVLGWFVGVTCPRRFCWLFSRRRWYVWATMLGTPPVYSAISNIKPLKHDLAHIDSWGAAFIVVWCLGMASMLGVIYWHIATVARQRRRADAAAYICSRLGLLAFLGGSAAVLAAQGVNMHLHHLYLGWSLALWAELDRPLSGATLAVGCGIFLQGVGAYSMAPVFQESCFTSPSSQTYQCKFWAGTPFSVQICSATGPMPQHTCV